MRFDPAIPNTCPHCGTAPYPWGTSCEVCGFHGTDRPQIHIWGRYLGWAVLLGLGGAMLWSIVALIRFDNQFPM